MASRKPNPSRKHSSQSTQTGGAERLPENIQQDAKRDLEHVPGTFNPGNQAGKAVEGGGQTPAGEPGRPAGQAADSTKSVQAGRHA